MSRGPWPVYLPLLRRLRFWSGYSIITSIRFICQARAAHCTPAPWATALPPLQSAAVRARERFITRLLETAADSTFSSQSAAFVQHTRCGCDLARSHEFLLLFNTSRCRGWFLTCTAALCSMETFLARRNTNNSQRAFIGNFHANSLQWQTRALTLVREGVCSLQLKHKH